MDASRALVLLYNAIVLLEDLKYTKEELLHELGITEVEYELTMNTNGCDL